MNEFLLITGMAIVTFSIRYVMFALSGRIRLSDTLLTALKYVPPVVLTAIVVPEVLMVDGNFSLTYTNARLVGAIAAFAVGWFSKNLLLTIVLGMLAFLGWQWVLDAVIA
jgi:branched-subunit amino acid transport protein